ncbi:virion structural protein [Klebsiella phage vB_KpM_FBKp24]|uniref:Putative virion structural protein n=1 Tax=Klebsiella phage vB_KpM_FBKp24 TaxID=2801834 RepID=A0A7U0J5A4_9CAUD|nr:hypothetical protein [Klebsiella pneumoniae]YP_010298984.1 virion structural protein [Klebsiella phage vB_KpM_FBKp24]QQV92053.1 putative virion structural protein [Klebsiella phage vB_KpM_FBKp24]
MLNAYSFVTIKNFINNAIGQTAKVGELTTYGETYSTDVGTYSVPDYTDVILKTLSVTRDGTKTDLGLTYYTQILEISQWLYQRSINGLITADSAALLQALNAQFSDFATVSEVGSIVNNGSYNFPSSLHLSFSNAGEANDLYVWYAIDNFLVEYPLYELSVVMPFDDIDILVGDADTAVSTINAITPVSNTARITAAIAQNPQTDIWTGYFTWVAKDNDEITKQIPINVVIYGSAGKNLDYIKDAIRDHILGNSASGTDVWEIVLPDLFTPTEYYVVPVWDRISLPNQLDSTALYSPVLPYKDFLTYTDKYMADYEQSHVINAGEIVFSVYQNLQLLVCGHVRNYNVSYIFSDLWPRYAAIPTTSSEFGKIPEATRNFIISLIALLKTAETATGTSILPTGYTRANRNGTYYITMTVDTVQYLVPIKSGFSKD